MAIHIYPGDCTNFSTAGLGILYPIECTVTEEAAGRYELNMEHPIDSTYRWAQLEVGRIIKAPVPVRENPAYEKVVEPEREHVTVTRTVYRVSTVKNNLNFRTGPGTSYRIIRSYRKGTEVIAVNADGQDSTQNGFRNVTIRDGGAVGWMAGRYLTATGEKITETLDGYKPANRHGVRPQIAREQLFRITEVERDTEAGIVRVKALHIFYDNRATFLDGTYEPKNQTPSAIVSFMLQHLVNPTATTFDVSDLTDNIDEMDCSYKSPVEILLDPDEGIAAKTGAQVVRDNFDCYLLQDEERDMGVTVRRGKNLVGVTATTDATNLVTRITALGKNSDGTNIALGNGTNYIDSPRIGDYPMPYSRKIDYPVKMVKSNPDNITTFTDLTRARAKLLELAQKDFSENHIDEPEYGLEVDFVLLQYADEMADYAQLQSVYLYDTVTVIDEMIGLYSKVRVTEYEWNVLTQQYNSVKLGKLTELRQTVYSYNLPTGGISGTKLTANSTPGSAIRNLSVQYGKFENATIEQLKADAISAVQAVFTAVTAQTINTDELTAAVAHVVQLAADSIEAGAVVANTLSAALLTASTATIENADIDWANIADLTADVATIAKAQLTTANIQDASIDWATILSAYIASVSIGYAQIKDADIQQLIAQDAVTRRYFIEKLQVLSAQIAEATVGNLVVKASNGNYYRLDIAYDNAGNPSVTPVGVTITQAEDDAGMTSDGHSSIIKTDLTVGDLAAGNLKAINALIDTLTASRIDVDTLFAREGTINKLNTQIIEAIDATDLAGRNLIINTLSPDVSSAEKYPRLRGQTYASESGSSTTEISTAEHGVRLTENARTGYIELRFGTPRSGYRSLNGLTPGETYTLAWDYVYSSSGRLNYISAQLCDDTVETGSPRIDQEVEWEISSEEAAHCKFTFTVPANVTMLYLTIRATSVTFEAGDYLELRNLTLVRGEAGKAWSPAPEDTQNGIETNRANITLNTQQIESTVERVAQTEGNVEALSTQLTQTAEDLTATLSQKVNASDVEAWARYSVSGGEGTLELGQKGSRYTTETSPTGFRVKQDGQDMTTMVRGRVAAPVFEVKRQIEIGNYSVRADADGGVLWI